MSARPPKDEACDAQYEELMWNEQPTQTSAGPPEVEAGDTEWDDIAIKGAKTSTSQSGLVETEDLLHGRMAYIYMMWLSIS